MTYCYNYLIISYAALTYSTFILCTFIYLGISFINEKLENLTDSVVDETDMSSADDQDETDFFPTKNRGSSDNALILRSFLDSPVDNLCDYTRWPLLRKLFIELNTPLPASAACERLFSAGGLIFRPHRASMTDVNFENCILVKCNKDFI